MSNFKEISRAVNEQFDMMCKGELYVVGISRDEIWEEYLRAFPEGSNPIYKERTEHDCNCCKGFIRDIGQVVSINKNSLVTVWDISINDPVYSVVSKRMADLIRSKPIKSIYRTDFANKGAKVTRQMTDDGVKSWDHFYCTVPSKFVTASPASVGSDASSSVDVFKRGMGEISASTLETVVDLIENSNLYRGQEFLKNVNDFLKAKKAYEKASNKNVFVWSEYNKPYARLRNTAIGTLIQDIEKGVDIEKAVKSFEVKVAPTNYKRPASVITQSMVKQATETVEELGIETALSRRYANITDVSINDVLFADKSVSGRMKKSILEDLLGGQVRGNTKVSKATSEVTIDEFFKDVLPFSNKVELFVENKLVGNMMSITAPVHADAARLFKWDNGFAWSYNGEVTDSIKERVKAAGGRVDALARVSLSWYNYDDLDLHCYDPDGRHIYFGNKSGVLDVDMNAGRGTSREAVENMVWDHLKKGTYRILVHNFVRRESVDVGFEIQFEYNGNTETFFYKAPVKDSEMIPVIDLYWDGKSFTVAKTHANVESSAKSKDVWGISTESFVPVDAIMLSPNYWGDSHTGNKHWFFLLKGCVNPDGTRGIYNEYLRPELEKHRKVLEILGGKTKCEYTDNQLSGVGFSSTKPANFNVRVDGRTFTVKV